MGSGGSYPTGSVCLIWRCFFCKMKKFLQFTFFFILTPLRFVQFLLPCIAFVLDQCHLFNMYTAPLASVVSKHGLSDVIIPCLKKYIPIVFAIT